MTEKFVLSVIRFHLNSPTKGYIRAEGCILFYYDSLKCVLYFSPGGDYTQ
ncbi:DUF3876 domain-containing protein [Bacteroides fragilis]|nr:DUF3876 domain-containing protein [Bacteroides fragilis]UVQ87591.1 DUF3876 domain-containing protein [Bacteroides fragilis]